MARLFDGDDDRIVYYLGAANTAINTAWSIAICCKPNSTSYGGLINTTGGEDWAIWIDSGTVWVFGSGGGSGRSFSGYSVTTADWQHLIVSKAAGTATPRLHAYNLGTETWTHTDGSVTPTNAVDGDLLVDVS